MLRFSAENNAFPALPVFSTTPFSDAWEAEVALVRLTVPCIEIKVLKHGGTLSKTHSVCLDTHAHVVPWPYGLYCRAVQFCHTFTSASARLSPRSGI